MSDAFALALSERLRGASRRPSIYAYHPHDKQDEFHASGAKGTVFIGGNRSGKTVAGCVETVRAATGQDPYRKYPEPPLRLRICTVDLKQGIEKIILPELHRWVPPSSLINGSWEDSWDKTHFTLTLSNESFIELLTYEQDVEKHAGTSRHAVWFDEEPPEGVFNEDITRLIDTGGTWRITMTPVEGLEWIFQLYNEIEVEGNPANKNVKFIQVDSYENPHISPDEIDALFINLDEDKKRARTRGMFEALGGKIYPHFSDRNILDMTNFQPPREWVRMEGMDSGWRVPTAWLWAVIDPIENCIYIIDEYYESGRTVSQHVPYIIQRSRLYGQPLYRVGDPAIKQAGPQTGTSVQYEYSKGGVFLCLGNNDVKVGIDRVSTLFGSNPKDLPRLYIGSHCKNLISEIRKYRWASYSLKKMEATRNKKEEPVKKDDHAVDALRYLVTAWFDWGTNPPEEAFRLHLGPKAIPQSGLITAEGWEETMADSEGSPLGSYY